MPSRAVQQGYTTYSLLLPGDDGNYGWQAQIDVHAAGYVGITQFDEHGHVKERVLLSPAQWAEAVRFVREEIPR